MAKKNGRPFRKVPAGYTPVFPVGTIVEAVRTRYRMVLGEPYMVAGVHLDRNDETIERYSLTNIRTGDPVYRVPMRRGTRRPLLRLSMKG